jgi:release factor glutamine methyltransferase
MQIYEPSEDSYLLQESLIKYLDSVSDKTLQILDMGSGSGIFSKTCLDKRFNNIKAADIDENVVIYLKNIHINCIKSDLFSNLISEKFDLIIFNPPYLPEDKKEPIESRLQTTAGKKGYELIIRFLEDSKNHLKNKGNILLLISSLSKPKVILKKAKELGYSYKLDNKKKIFFEELYVYQLSLK